MPKKKWAREYEENLLTSVAMIFSGLVTWAATFWGIEAILGVLLFSVASLVYNGYKLSQAPKYMVRREDIEDRIRREAGLPSGAAVKVWVEEKS